MCDSDGCLDYEFLLTESFGKVLLSIYWVLICSWLFVSLQVACGCNCFMGIGKLVVGRILSLRPGLFCGLSQNYSCSQNAS